MENDTNLLQRNPIVGASSVGIIVRVDGQDEIRGWDRVTSVTAAPVKHGDGSIFVLAVEFNDVRVFVIGEIEPGWAQLVEQLPIGLPGVEPFAKWGPKLLAAPDVVELFERAV